MVLLCRGRVQGGTCPGIVLGEYGGASIGIALEATAAAEWGGRCCVDSEVVVLRSGSTLWAAILIVV